MRKVDLRPGDVVAVRTYGDRGREAIVIATKGYYDGGRYSWRSSIRSAEGHPHIRTPKVAIASKHIYDGESVWRPELVMPQQILSDWPTYEVEQAERRRREQERTAAIHARAEQLRAQREELTALMEQAGMGGSIRPYFLTASDVSLPVAEAIKLFKRLIELEGANDAVRSQPGA